jgi:signal transduction histidine kinase
MQAPLSNTASGKAFHTASFTATASTASHPAPRRYGNSSSIDTFGFRTRSSTPGLSDGLGLAHDAGNLLGALGLYCELLGRPGVLRDEHRHYAEELQLLSGRSRHLIDRLLDPTTTGRRKNISSSTAETGEEQVVIPDVIEGCRSLLNAVARRAVAVAYGAGAALPVSVSREALERILVNLTKNAAEASDTGSEAGITLRVTCQQREDAPGQIVLTVEDKGRGMSTAAVKVLLSRSRREVESGSRGIGFQVVRELVGASGGTLRLRSREGGIGRGTTVEIVWDVSGGVSTARQAASPGKKRQPLTTTGRAARESAAGSMTC